MLDIPNDTERLIRLIGETIGQPPEQVIRDAVEQRARALGVAVREAKPVDMDRVNAIIERSASRPLLDRRSAKEILDEAWGDPA